MINGISLTAQVVTAYVASNKLSASVLASLIISVRAALDGLDQDEREVVPVESLAKSKAEIRRSITPDALISFLDGKPYRTLKRHLALRGMTLADYRARFGLPDDYPATAASYSAQRSALALAAGFGRMREQEPAPATPTEAALEPKAARTRGSAKWNL